MMLQASMIAVAAREVKAEKDVKYAANRPCKALAQPNPL